MYSVLSLEIKCGPNQLYTDCSRPCRKTCRDPYGLEDQCRKPHCECIEGYVFYNGHCIPIEKCPPVHCPANKTYQVENIAFGTCNMYVNINLQSPGCYCQSDYVLNRITGECVLSEDCPEGKKIF